jgi:hypothetical protein
MYSKTMGIHVGKEEWMDGERKKETKKERKK